LPLAAQVSRPGPALAGQPGSRRPCSAAHRWRAAAVPVGPRESQLAEPGSGCGRRPGRSGSAIEYPPAPASRAHRCWAQRPRHGRHGLGPAAAVGRSGADARHRRRLRLRSSLVVRWPAGRQNPARASARRAMYSAPVPVAVSRILRSLAIAPSSMGREGWTEAGRRSRLASAHVRPGDPGMPSCAEIGGRYQPRCRRREARRVSGWSADSPSAASRHTVSPAGPASLGRAANRTWTCWPSTALTASSNPVPQAPGARSPGRCANQRRRTGPGERWAPIASLSGADNKSNNPPAPTVPGSRQARAPRGRAPAHRRFCCGPVRAGSRGAEVVATATLAPVVSAHHLPLCRRWCGPEIGQHRRQFHRAGRYNRGRTSRPVASRESAGKGRPGGRSALAGGGTVVPMEGLVNRRIPAEGLLPSPPPIGPSASAPWISLLWATAPAGSGRHDRRARDLLENKQPAAAGSRRAPAARPSAR